MGFRFKWHGHSCIEVESPGGKVILFDSWFGNPRSDMPADRVDRCDLLLITHGHFDHFTDALAIASRLRPTWPCIHEMSLYAGRRHPGGTDAVIGMNKGGTVEAAGLQVSMVHADHSSGDLYEGGGEPVYLGEPVGFVVELEDGTRIYNTGDTDVFGDMALIREFHRPDVAFLPIGGHFTMGPRQAALAAELIGARTIVPLHYGTFPVLTGTPDELRGALRARGVEAEVLSPEPGVIVSVD
jgi:L-ascorbate metabolism protein UlaG (beta-lactamase superfamily)